MLLIVSINHTDWFSNCLLNVFRNATRQKCEQIVTSFECQVHAMLVIVIWIGGRRGEFPCHPHVISVKRQFNSWNPLSLWLWNLWKFQLYKTKRRRRQTWFFGEWGVAFVSNMYISKIAQEICDSLSLNAILGKSRFGINQGDIFTDASSFSVKVTRKHGGCKQLNCRKNWNMQGQVV